MYKPITDRPSEIIKYRDGRTFFYLGVWRNKSKIPHVYDQMDSKEVTYWRRKGVKIRESKG